MVVTHPGLAGSEHGAPMSHPGRTIMHMAASSVPTLEIAVQCRRETVFNRGARRPLQDRTVYTCCGLDGTRFQQTNKAELMSLMRRRYGSGRRLVFRWVAEA